LSFRPAIWRGWKRHHAVNRNLERLERVHVGMSDLNLWLTALSGVEMVLVAGGAFVG
jgi:hypothetical protein